jgi:uncharacterized membrane protein
MNSNLITAAFDSRSEAERAVSELRNAGVRDSAISIIAQHDGKNTTTDASGTVTNEGEHTPGLATGIIGGAGVGTLLGIAALAIPGVGPLVAAGAIASAAIPGAALTGAALGAAAGGLTTMPTDHGVSDEDASYYESRINEGGVFVSVDTANAGVSSQTAEDILYGAGGHSSSRAAGKVSGAFDGHDDPNRGPLDRTANALGGHDDPNRGPVDRASNALHGTDDPNRGPLDRAQNALGGRDDPIRGPLDRAANALGGYDDPNRGPIDRAANVLDRKL